MSNPRVSVCIPTYNGKKYLDACIGSVRTQTFTDFEVLVCDDHSSDGTLELARQLAQGDERFRFILNPHRFGLVGNWNNCINQARGQWIKFVFQDDTIAPTCIEKLLSACLRNDLPFAFCERDLIFEEGTPSALREWFLDHRNYLKLVWQNDPVILPERAMHLLSRDVMLNLVGEPTAALIRKSVFEEIGLFDETLIQACDSEFWFRAMITYGACFVPESLAVFRIHAGATTASNHGNREYRTRVLDPLVVRYRLAFAPQYRPLRRRGVSGKSALARRIDCAMFAAYALRQLKQRIRAGGEAQEDVLAEWKTIVAQCRGMRVLAFAGTVGHEAHKLIRVFEQGTSAVDHEAERS